MAVKSFLQPCAAVALVVVALAVSEAAHEREPASLLHGHDGHGHGHDGHDGHDGHSHRRPLPLSHQTETDETVRGQRPASLRRGHDGHRRHMSPPLRAEAAVADDKVAAAAEAGDKGAPAAETGDKVAAGAEAGDAVDEPQCGDQTDYDNNTALYEQQYGQEQLRQLLLAYGGLPGKVDAKHATNFEVLPALVRPGTPDDQDPDLHFDNFFEEDSAASALYNHSSSDNTTFIRVERAFLVAAAPVISLVSLVNGPTLGDATAAPPQRGTKGELWWTPANVCGYLRVLEYSVVGDAPPLLEVKRKHCEWRHADEEIECYGPDAYEATLSTQSVSAPLIASLVG